MSAGKQKKNLMRYSTAKLKSTLKNDSSRRVNSQPVISFPGRQQILSSSLYRGTPAKSGIIWFYCFLSNNSPSLRLRTGFVLIKWPFCSPASSEKRTNWQKRDEICGFLLVESQVLSTLSSEPLQRQEGGDPCYPLGSAISRALETTSTMWFCFSCNGWAISPHPFPPLSFPMDAHSPPALLVTSFPEIHTHPAQNQHFFSSKSRRNHEMLKHPSAAVQVNLPKVFQILQSPFQNISEKFYSSFPWWDFISSGQLLPHLH